MKSVNGMFNSIFHVPVDVHILNVLNLSMWGMANHMHLFLYLMHYSRYPGAMNMKYVSYERIRW